MAKNITTTTTEAATVKAAPTPSKRQATLIELATRKKGVTRAEVREALGYNEGANIAIQTMLKKIAERFGLTWDEPTMKTSATSARMIAFYHMTKPAPVAKTPVAKAAAKTAAKPVKTAPVTPAKAGKVAKETPTAAVIASTKKTNAKRAAK